VDANEEADPSGKRRLRDDNLGVFPKVVKRGWFRGVYLVAKLRPTKIAQKGQRRPAKAGRYRVKNKGMS
jgi:hypothetical protein